MTFELDGQGFATNALEEFFKVEHFAHSVSLFSGKSDLRIQLQTDSGYGLDLILQGQPVALERAVE